MSAFQAIIDEIMSKRRDLSRDQIRVLIEEKKKELPGFLSDEGAARLVAEELLIRTRGTELGRMQVRDLVSGLNDVSISGRILLLWSPRTFERRDGTLGRVMRLMIVDRSGKVQCILWDKHVEVVSRTDNLQGSILRLGHAYTRQGIAGDVEVHAGDRSSIEINPREPVSDFPEFSDLFIQIGDIPNESFNVNTVGVIQIAPRTYSFTKEDRTGAVLRTILADQSGTIPVVAWNERAEELRHLSKGDILQIVNARTRLNSNSRVELHVETRSQVSTLKEPPAYLKMPVEQTHKIAELTRQSSLVNLNVTVIAKGERREIKRTSGETVKVSAVIVGDETGMLTLSLWDEKADLVDELQEGDVIHLRNVSVRDRLGELRLSLGGAGEIERLTSVNQNVISPTKLNALASAKNLVTVQGTIVDQPIIRQVSTQKGETIDVASFSLQDETGTIRVTFWREQVKLAKELRAGVLLKIIGVRVHSGLTGQIELTSVPLTKVSMITTPSNSEFVHGEACEK